MYQQWRAHRYYLGLEYIGCDLDSKSLITKENLIYTMCRFLTEVKQVDGSDFPGKKLHNIAICIQFHLGSLWKVINDEAFHNIKFTLNNLMKMHVQQGIGCQVRKAEIFTPTDEDALWSMGFLSTSNPTQLLNTVVFVIGKGFALCAGKKHRALQELHF